tara:strand:+ start:1692 stop:3266 length:1575 start_codon:yes stop_codon:yes gene_type:complete
MSNQKSTLYYLPIVASLFTVIGLLLGKYLYQDGSLVSFSGNDGKVEEVISTVVDRYVDIVDQTEITDHAIVSLLEQLDPHSTYLPASKVPRVREQMRGNFVGIGIEFRIIDDSLVVVSPIKGGPSEVAGMLSGDRLIGLNGEEVSLGKLSTDSLISLLRGKAGSELSILVYRPFSKKKITVNLTRKEIPIYSIDASFLLNDSTAFVKINRFAQKTPVELKTAVKQLIKEGANNLIIDLRGNPGGSLTSVKEMCNEFLSEGDTILSTRRQGEIDMSVADGTGSFKKIPLVIIVDRNSASASEILTGTLQDNDRAIIVGRRTFGKGLVQAVISLQDKSRINLTIAKYHLPSGRCIQKPYVKDQLQKYRAEHSERIEGKNFNNLPDSLKYYTKSGRPVYAQSGVSPDIFIPFDTTYITKFSLQLSAKDIIRDLVVKFYNAERLTGSSAIECLERIDEEQLIETLRAYSLKKDIEWNEKEWGISRLYVLNKIKAYIVRMKFGKNGYFKISSSMDQDILKAQNASLKKD